MSSELVNIEDVKVALDHQDPKGSPVNARSSKKVTISTEADQILEARNEKTGHAVALTQESAENVSETKEEVMWVKYNELHMTKRINFLYSRLARGLPTKLEAFGMAIGTAVYMAQSVQKTLDGVKFEQYLLPINSEFGESLSIGIRLTRDAQAKTVNKARYVKKADLEKVEVPVAQPAVDEAKLAEKHGILRHREPSAEP